MRPVDLIVQRAAKRLLAIYGWQPAGVLCAVILLFAVVADHFIAEYRDLSEQNAVLDKKSRDMKLKIGQQQKLEAVLKEKRELLAQQSAKGISAATAELAGAAFLSELQNQATAAGAKVVGGSPLPPRSADGIAVIQAEGELEAQTRQLVAMLEGMAKGPKGIKVTALKVNVQDPAQPAKLTVKLTAQGFFIEPIKGEKPGGR